jgi:hypothetical protein
LLAFGFVLAKPLSELTTQQTMAVGTSRLAMFAHFGQPRRTAVVLRKTVRWSDDAVQLGNPVDLERVPQSMADQLVDLCRLAKIEWARPTWLLLATTS